MSFVEKTGFSEEGVIMLALLHGADRMQELLNKEWVIADDASYRRFYELKQAFDEIYAKYVAEGYGNV